MKALFWLCVLAFGLLCSAQKDYKLLRSHPREQLENRVFQPRSWLGSQNVWYRNGEQPFWVEEDKQGDWHETWYEDRVDRYAQIVYLTDHHRQLNAVISPDGIVIKRWHTDEIVHEEKGRWGKVYFFALNYELWSYDRESWFVKFEDSIEGKFKARDTERLYLAENTSNDFKWIHFTNDNGDEFRVSLTSFMITRKGEKVSGLRGMWRDEGYDEELVRDVQPEIINPGKSIALLTLNTPNIHNWAVYSERNQIHYAFKHGYTLYIYRSSLMPRKTVHWGKIVASMRHLPDHEYLMWIDSDAIITDMNVKIEDKIAKAPSKNFYACGDIGGWMLNTGVMIFKNSPWANKMLADLWAKDHITHARGAEQSTLIKMLSEQDKHKEHWELFPECEFNCHPRHHEEGHYILHMMGDSGENRIREFTKWNLRFGVDMTGLAVAGHKHDEL